jgi:hypothetical protein
LNPFVGQQLNLLSNRELLRSKEIAMIVSRRASLKVSLHHGVAVKSTATMNVTGRNNLQTREELYAMRRGEFKSQERFFMGMFGGGVEKTFCCEGKTR